MRDNYDLKETIEKLSIKYHDNMSNDELLQNTVKEYINSKLDYIQPIKEFSGEETYGLEEEVFCIKCLNGEIISAHKGIKNDKEYLIFRRKLEKNDIRGTVFEFSSINDFSLLVQLVRDLIEKKELSEKYNKKNEKKATIHKVTEIINATQMGLKVGFDNVTYENESDCLHFIVENTSGFNARVELTDIKINDILLKKSFTSELIPNSKKTNQVSFSISNPSKEHRKIILRIKAKTKINGVPRAQFVWLEIITNYGNKSFLSRIVPFNEIKTENQEKERKPLNRSGLKKIELVNYRSVIVYTNNITCKRLGHTFVNDSAIVSVCQDKSGVPYIQQYEIPVCKCYKCKAFYMLESVYKELKAKGHIMCQILSQDQFDRREYGLVDDVEHIMYKCGYSVKADGLTSIQRHVLLEEIIQSDIVSLSQAVNHIKYLIRRNELNGNMINAIEKWQEDIEYLTGQRIKTGIKKIIKSEDVKIIGIYKYPV